MKGSQSQTEHFILNPGGSREPLKFIEWGGMIWLDLCFRKSLGHNCYLLKLLEKKHCGQPPSCVPIDAANSLRKPREMKDVIIKEFSICLGTQNLSWRIVASINQYVFIKCLLCTSHGIHISFMG